jgi:hypothetical protein
LAAWRRRWHACVLRMLRSRGGWACELLTSAERPHGPRRTGVPTRQYDASDICTSEERLPRHIQPYHTCQKTSFLPVCMPLGDHIAHWILPPRTARSTEGSAYRTRTKRVLEHGGECVPYKRVLCDSGAPRIILAQTVNFIRRVRCLVSCHVCGVCTVPPCTLAG